jgi:hypothetical protein
LRLSGRKKIAVEDVITWLLDGDPAVRWQTQRDLLDADAEVYTAERERVASQGWGQRLLAQQDAGGTWGGGLYSPKWISTTYTLLTLRYLGLPPGHAQALVGCELLLEGGYYPPDGGINFSATFKHSETCITGMVLSVAAYFRCPDERVHGLAEHLLGQQMSDGGWNCRSYRGDTHSSFHTTISALEGLHEYAKAFPAKAVPVDEAQARAREFMLVHRLYRSHRTGEVVDGRMTRFPFPPRWYFDVLRGLDYFQAVGSKRDDRLKDPLALLHKKRRKDGRWPAYRGYSGRRFFEMEPAGQPGRVNTLRALRVLRWWQQG